MLLASGTALKGERWTPAKLGPSLWIEPRRGGLYQSNAGSGTLATADSDNVGYAPDLSGNGFHLTSAADDTTRPTLNGTATFPYLSFNGTNQVLLRTEGLGIESSLAGYTVAVALQSNSPATGRYLFSNGSSANTNTIFCPLATNNSTSTSWGIQYRDDGGSINDIAITVDRYANLYDNAAHVALATDDRTSFIPYKDGVAGTTVSYTRGTGSGVYTLARTSLGALVRSNTAGWWAGRVYGLVVVKRILTADERMKLTSYMARLAGLSF